MRFASNNFLECSYSCISSGICRILHLRVFTRPPAFPRRISVRKWESRALRIAKRSVTWQEGSRRGVRFQPPRKDLPLMWSLLPTNSNVLLLRTWDISFQIRDSRAITLEYLDSHKSPVTRPGYRERKRGEGDEKRGFSLVTSTRVIGENFTGAALNPGMWSTRLNSVHEFKTGLEYPRVSPTSRLMQLCTLTFAYSLYCHIATRCVTRSIIPRWRKSCFIGRPYNVRTYHDVLELSKKEKRSSTICNEYTVLNVEATRDEWDRSNSSEKVTSEEFTKIFPLMIILKSGSECIEW